MKREIRWWEIKYDIERYGMYEDAQREPLYPLTVLVRGSLAQAKLVADRLSSDEAGCDYLFYVVGDDGARRYHER